MQENEDVGKLLRERDRIDDKLHQHKKKTAVIFIDIKGSMSYFDRWGDIEGRLMVQRCEDIILPVIAKYMGNKKHLGDGVMVYFESTEPAVRAAVEIQQAFRIHNKGKHDRQQAHVRIGVNSGMVFVENGDIMGEEVGIASRVESLAPVDGIYVTRNVYEDVKNSDEIICRYVGERTVKGKAEPLHIYQVVWSEDEMTVGKLRGHSIPDEKGSATPSDEKIFYLEFLREEDRIRVRSHEGVTGEQKTLKHYEDLKISIGKTEDYSRKIKDLLNRANRSGKISKEILNGLKQTGQLLYDELFPARTKEMLNNTGIKTLVLGIDDGLVHIPWELVFDGKEFLCQRFNMGRVVSTRQDFTAGQRDVNIPLKMLVLSDPQGNLKASYEEGIKLRDRLDEKADVVNVNLKSSDIHMDYVKGKLRYFDIMHYAGHADYDGNDPSESGFLLSDGKLRAKDIKGMTGRMPLPAFVFSNACYSGQTEEWKAGSGYEDVYGLANAFLLSGVRHYLGTFWQIQDEPGLHFAIGFYEELMKGTPIGEAVRKARMGLVEKYGEDTIIWASYMLYGDPTFRYVDLSRQKEKKEPAALEEGETAGSPSRSADEQVILFPSKAKTRLYAAAFALMLAVMIGVFVYRQKTVVPPGVQVATQMPQPDMEDRKAEKIDKLVADLAKRYREGKVSQKVNVEPSGPPSLVFLEIKNSGVSDMETDYIVNKVAEELQGSKKLTIVDRQLLNELLKELKLSTSSLADPNTALKLGRIFSARFISTGSIVREKNDWMVSLRIIETETTAVKASITSTIHTKDKNEVAANISGKLLDKIKTEYPQPETGR